MLEFVYDYIKKYLPDDCLEFIKMDPHGLYMALTWDSFQELVKLEPRKEFFKTMIIFFLA